LLIGWPIPSNTLYITHNNCLFISNTHLPRRELQMDHSLPARKQSINIVHLPVYPCRARPILRILHIPRNVKYRSHPTIYSHSNSFYRLRITLRTNIILGSDSHHKSTIGNPVHQNRPCRMNLGRLLH
uniref:Uncharacterized protein n=1 Tax=Sus scrofa TaxID=9823 RepID=A0A4X1VFL7_PIG